MVREGEPRIMDGNHYSKQPWGQARILLIEDDPGVRETVALALHAVGWQVEGAASGEEGLVAFGRAGFDLVILDLGLPGLPGVDVLRQLRARSEVLVLVMTASGDLDDRVNGFDDGAAIGCGTGDGLEML